MTTMDFKIQGVKGVPRCQSSSDIAVPIGSATRQDSTCEIIISVPRQTMLTSQSLSEFLQMNLQRHSSIQCVGLTEMGSQRDHIKACHVLRSRQVYPCSRCQTIFTSEDERETHIKVPNDQICDVKKSQPTEPTYQGVGGDPEDGITVTDQLAKRKEVEKIMDWNKLWKFLFPDDSIDQIPSPGENETSSGRSSQAR
jgi:hypothetical protein